MDGERVTARKKLNWNAEFFIVVACLFVLTCAGAVDSQTGLEATAPQSGEIIHVRYSPGDQILECIRKVWKKSVLWDQEIAIDEQWQLTCPASKEEFLRELSRAQISVLEDEHWAFFIPSKYLPPWPAARRCRYWRFHR